MEKLSKYEKARLLGARSLQLAMGAPFLVKLSKEDLEKINYNTLEIAKLELEKGKLPLEIIKPSERKAKEEAESKKN